MLNHGTLGMGEARHSRRFHGAYFQFLVDDDTETQVLDLVVVATCVIGVCWVFCFLAFIL